MKFQLKKLNLYFKNTIFITNKKLIKKMEVQETRIPEKEEEKKKRTKIRRKENNKDNI